MELLLGCASHVERLENTGILARSIAVSLGAAGPAAPGEGALGLLLQLAGRAIRRQREHRAGLPLRPIKH